MPLICYIPKTFARKSERLIDEANKVITAMRADGYTLTLRQLYYALVSQNVIPNNLKSYGRLGYVVSEARRAGLIDWDAIEDRGRFLRRVQFWEDAAEIMDGSARGFNVDKWADQGFRPEVWVEKDALIGVVQRACAEYEVPYFSCRGYVSDSECWGAARRLRRHAEGGQTPVIFHLGDHDPSGRDMTRDILERVQLFAKGAIRIERLALNMDQIEEHEPPPNPAKQTDSRFAAYAEQFGEDSWELDALSPKVIGATINAAVKPLVDQKKWKAAAARVDDTRALLGTAAERWDDVAAFLRSGRRPPRPRPRKPKAKKRGRKRP